MTPAQHISKAELSVKTAEHLKDQGFAQAAQHHVLVSIAHALIAQAVEAGVPHGADPAASS